MSMPVQKVLICTVGHDVENKTDWPADRTVFSALRNHQFDRLVALVSRKDLDCVTVAKLKGFFKERPGKLEIVAIDTSDFFVAYQAIQRVLGANAPHMLCIDISGGEKVLAATAVFCAFNNGIAVFHNEAETFTRLPIIRGFSVFVAYTDDQQRIVSAIKGKMTLQALYKMMAREGMDEEAVKDGLCYLKKKDVGIVESWSEKGRTKVVLTEKGLVLKKLLPKKVAERKASIEKEDVGGEAEAAQST